MLVLVCGMALLIPAGYISVILGLLMAMGPDSCGSSTNCAPANERLIGWLPIVGLGSGLLVGIVGGTLFVRHGKSPALWVCLAWILLLLSVIASYTVVTAR